MKNENIARMYTCANKSNYRYSITKSTPNFNADLHRKGPRTSNCYRTKPLAGSWSIYSCFHKQEISCLQLRKNEP